MFIIRILHTFVLLSKNIRQIYNNIILLSMKVVHYSCKPGIELVPKKGQDELRIKLNEAFGNQSYASYFNKIRDYRNIPYHIKEEIDAIFREYGIEPDQVWNIWESNDDETLQDPA